MVVAADGNPGAAIVLLELVRISESFLAILDKLDIVGEDIALLFHDVCGKSVDHFAALVIAAYGKVGGLDGEKLRYAAHNEGVGIDADILAQNEKKIVELAKKHLI
jgi:hypothetical protein